ncbi:MAG: hypothetical protein K2H01_09230, partial [Ruminococcus sp.]|nr:hypothetical protein [Ruminococcus sp.]
MEVSMINLMLSGGLGNQMFEYAYARALSEAFGDEIIINPYYNRLYGMYMKLIKGNPEYVNYQLDLFELNPNIRMISAVKGTIKALSEIVPGLMVRFGGYDPKTTQEKYTKKTYNGKFKMIEKEFT